MRECFDGRIRRAGASIVESFPRGIQIAHDQQRLAICFFEGHRGDAGNGGAAISGDFVLLASEVNPVIRELRAGGIDVTALHSHMLEAEPRFFFMHFWANDDALKLARALRAALDRTNRAR